VHSVAVTNVLTFVGLTHGRIEILLLTTFRTDCADLSPPNLSTLCKVATAVHTYVGMGRRKSIALGLALDDYSLVARLLRGESEQS